MSVKDIHQKDNVVDYRSTDGGDGRPRGGIQGYRLVELAYSPRSVGHEAPIVVAKRLKGAPRTFRGITCRTTWGESLDFILKEAIPEG